MNPLDALVATNIDPALLLQVRALFEQQQAKLARKDAVLAENDFKIKALTFELAYYKRIRFGKASEAGSVALIFLSLPWIRHIVFNVKSCTACSRIFC